MTKKNLVVKKDNALVSSSYSLTLAEQRMVLLAIAGSDTLNGRHIVTAEQYADCYKVTPQTAYEALKGAVLQLFERRYSIRSERAGGRVKLRRWVSGIDYIEGTGSVELYFSPDVLPYLDDLKSQFTAYRLELVANLTSTHAIRLYELLIQWRSVGKTPVFELETFRGMLGIQPTEYPRMDNLKNRVLDVAIQQINDHTDIIAQYKQHKTGRKITGISFSFSFKKDAQATDSKRCSGTIDFVDEQNLTAKQLGYYAKLLANSHWATMARVMQGVNSKDAISVITAHIKKPKNLARLMPTITKLIAAAKG